MAVLAISLRRSLLAYPHSKGILRCPRRIAHVGELLAYSVRIEIQNRATPLERPCVAWVTLGQPVDRLSSQTTPEFHIVAGTFHDCGNQCLHCPKVFVL
jgi:hypothetical protein